MNLLALNGAVWLDVAFFVILLLGALIGTWRGFIKGVCKLAGTFFSLFVAVTFCNAFKNTLESWFGLTSALANAFGGTQTGITAAGWVSIAISFVALFILVKLLSWLLGQVGTSLVERFSVCKKINRFLGTILGLVEGAILIFLLLTICYWIPSESLHAYIGQSTIVGAIFNWDAFIWAAEFSFIQ